MMLRCLNTTYPVWGVQLDKNDDEYIIIVDAPGADKKSIKVSIEENNVLTVNWERGPNDIQMVKAIRLPENTIDEERVEAKYKNGELTITLPLSRSARPTVIPVM